METVITINIIILIETELDINLAKNESEERGKVTIGNEETVRGGLQAACMSASTVWLQFLDAPLEFQSGDRMSL